MDGAEWQVDGKVDGEAFGSHLRRASIWIDGPRIKDQSYLDGIVSEYENSYLWMNNTITGRINSCGMAVLLSSLVESVYFPIARKTAALSLRLSS